jgi:hypothetical protein
MYGTIFTQIMVTIYEVGKNKEANSEAIPFPLNSSFTEVRPQSQALLNYK